MGNGLVTNRAFDAVTGWLKSIQTGAGGGTGVQNLAYTWDLVGKPREPQGRQPVEPHRGIHLRQSLSSRLLAAQCRHQSGSGLRRARQHHEQVRCRHLHLPRHQEAPGGVDQQRLELRIRQQRQHDQRPRCDLRMDELQLSPVCQGGRGLQRNGIELFEFQLHTGSAATGGRSPTTRAAARPPRSMSAGFWRKSRRVRARTSGT